MTGYRTLATEKFRKKKTTTHHKMKLGDYSNIAGFEKKINNPGVGEKITGKIAIGKADGATNFTMRVFTLAPGGFTPKHIHTWEQF